MVHSTTGEVPAIRFQRAKREGKSLFRDFVIPSPYTSTKDIFSLRVKRENRLNFALTLMRKKV